MRNRRRVAISGDLPSASVSLSAFRRERFSSSLVHARDTVLAPRGDVRLPDFLTNDYDVVGKSRPFCPSRASVLASRQTTTPGASFVKRATLGDFAFLVVVILLTGLLAQVASKVIGGQTSPPDLWSILSSIATAAATIVALWVALKSNREKDMEEAVRSRLAAAQLTPALVMNIGKITVIRDQFAQFVAVDPQPQAYFHVLNLLKEVVSTEPDFETMRAIAPLSNNCAERMAAGFAQIKLVFQMLEQARMLYLNQAANIETRKSRSSTFAGLTEGVLEALEPTVDICNNASTVKLGGPDVK